MSPSVTIDQGTLQGREKEGVQLFANVPYAAPPTGSLSFDAQRPHEGWDVTRDATAIDNAAPHRARPGGMTDAPPRLMDEDCLILNVQTPACDHAGRPVLVWIHGGGFRTGQGAIPWYNGSSFAAQGIVCVTINYRLGALGFANVASLGDEAKTSGLNGILDQVAALEWVRDNVAAFGGDPERVTIAGESAGGMSVGTLLGLPKASGLFRGAIPQSGACHHTRRSEETREIGELLCRFAGADDLAALRALDVERILDAQDQVEKELEGQGELSMPFQPTVDGDLLPVSPIEAVAGGASADVPVMTGTCAHETTLFGFEADDMDRVRKFARRYFDGESAADAALTAYQQDHPGASCTDLLVALTTDQTFRIPAVRLVEAHTRKGGRSHQYLFSWESRAFGGRLRSCHALEIPFAFNNLGRAGVAAFLGEGETPQSVADAMHAAWTNFVKNGDPNGEGVPEWPAFDEQRRAVMEFGDHIGTLDDPQPASRAVWDGVR